MTMQPSNPNESLTRRVLEEVLDERVPLILGQFTDGVLLPAVERIVHDEVSQSEHRLKELLGMEPFALS